MQCKNTFRISMIFSLVSMTIVSTSSSIFFVAGITSEIIALSVSRDEQNSQLICNVVTIICNLCLIKNKVLGNFSSYNERLNRKMYTCNNLKLLSIYSWSVAILKIYLCLVTKEVKVYQSKETSLRCDLHKTVIKYNCLCGTVVKNLW